MARRPCLFGGAREEACDNQPILRGGRGVRPWTEQALRLAVAGGGRANPPIAIRFSACRRSGQAAQAISFHFQVAGWSITAGQPKLMSSCSRNERSTQRSY